MKKVLFSIVLVAVMCAGTNAQTTRIPVKLITGSDEQQVYLLGWQDEQIWYGLPGATGRFGVYPRDVKEIVFPIELDQEQVNKHIKDREYDQAIKLLEEGLKPFQSYRNLPSNMTAHQINLMELYNKIGNYETSLAYSLLLVGPDRDPDWPPKCGPEMERTCYVFQGLALMELNRIEEAEKLFEQRGWTTDMPDDAPAEDLYITAEFMANKKDYTAAIKMAAKVVAFNSDDPEWLRPAELLCAEMYAELGMYESADEVIREIMELYKNTDVYDQAQQLKFRIDDLRRSN